MVFDPLQKNIRTFAMSISGLINEIEDWCKQNLAEPYLTHQMNGPWWCFRILLMNEMDAFRVKMRWGGEQFAHVEFREPEVIARKRAGTGIIA